MSGRKEGSDRAFSRSRPLLKNLGREEVVITTPGGKRSGENSRMSKAERRVVHNVSVRRLSGGEVRVRM